MQRSSGGKENIDQFLIELPTGARRFIRSLIRDDKGALTDARFSIYKAIHSLDTSVIELSEAFPNYSFSHCSV